MGKPLSGATAFLYNRKRSVSLHIKVGEDGWVRFPMTAAGNYSLILDGPSHESFDIVLHSVSENAQAILVSFSKDYCASVSLGKDPISFHF